MKIIKKLTVAFLSLALIFSTTACSDLTWSVKTDDNTLAIGVYIYYMSSAYSEAYYKVEDHSGDILSQTIEDKNASDWIKDTALDSCKKLLAVEKLLKDAGSSLTEDELATADSTTSAQWNQYGKTYESFGVSKESFNRAYSIYNQEYLKLFNSTYGPDGTKAVSDEELKNFFTENYINYSYISKDFVKDDSEQMSDEEKSEVENKFNSYLDSLNNGSTMDKIAETYKADYSLDNNPLTSDVSKLDENSTLPEEVSNALKEMESNTSKVIKTDSTCYLIHKGNINDNIDKLEKERDSILANMKSDEFSNMVKETSDSLNVNINQKAINKYQPSIFSQNSKKSK